MTDATSTGIHIRNIGPRPVTVSIYPSCGASGACPPIEDALLPPVSNDEDGSNDYIYTYTTDTVAPLTYRWSIRVPQGRAKLGTLERLDLQFSKNRVKQP